MIFKFVRIFLNISRDEKTVDLYVILGGEGDKFKDKLAYKSEPIWINEEHGWENNEYY